MKTIFLATAAVAIMGASAASAANTSNVVNGDQTVSTSVGTVAVYDAPGERGGLGYNAVTSNHPDNHGGNGSLEIHGDRSREVVGNIYGNGTNNLFNLADLSSLTYDKLTASTTSSQLHAEPVGRVHGYDSTYGSRFEIINEGVYNGGTAGVAPTLNTWTNVGDDQVWYVNVRTNGAAFLAHLGAGYTLSDGNVGVLYYNGSQINDQLTDLYSFFSSNTGVSGFSFGAGSGFGSGFDGAVDNVKFTVAGSTNTLDFETRSAAPEPSSWALMIVGFGAIGATMRRRKVAVSFG